MKYRSPAPLGMAASLAVVANLASRLFFVGLAQRQAWMATFVVAVALSLSFVYRAARNLEVIGDGHARYTPGQSVGWFFVPLLNIYCGHQVLTALWRDSQPVPRRATSKAADFSVLAVNVWLGFWVAATAAPFALAGLRVGMWVAVALTMGQGVAFIVVVLGIAARQREQWLDLERRRAVPPPTANALR